MNDFAGSIAGALGTGLGVALDPLLWVAVVGVAAASRRTWAVMLVVGAYALLALALSWQAAGGLDAVGGEHLVARLIAGTAIGLAALAIIALMRRKSLSGTKGAPGGEAEGA